MNTKHVTSLEISKQLAEAGIVIESEYWWFPIYDFGGDEDLTTWKLIKRGSELHGSEVLSAPIATEILERLPSEMTNDKGDWSCSLTLINAFDFWVVTYQDGELNTVGEQIESKYLPNALALLLIRLTKDGLI